MIVDTAARTLSFAGKTVPCRIGRAGACPASAKREGDGRTPIGRWPVLGALLRPDRGFGPSRALPWRWLAPDDGWSDDPADPGYNRPVRLPHAFSAERLWRVDGAYDAILWLGHNHAPVVPEAGSAIFVHLHRDVDTEGCVAIDRATMAALLDELPARAELAIG